MSEIADDEDNRVRASSGNVFVDLDVTEPEEEYAKATLATRIVRIIRERGWTQAQAAAAMGIDQPKVSAIVRMRLTPFSTERLVRFLTRLDHDVEIVVRLKAAGAARATLRVSIIDESLAVP